MSSRALSLATVLLLIGFGAADPVFAQATNLEAGKTPSQLFAQTCNVCHKSPRGLLKSVAPGSLPGFLRQHYTTSPDMAGILASYLVSNGATDTRYQAKDGKDKKDGAKEKEANTAPGQAGEHQGRRPRAQDAARPDGEAAPAAEGARQKRAARPAEDGAKDGAKPEGQASPEGRKGKRRGKPGTEEAPKVDTAAPATEEKKSEPKPDAAKVESGRDEAKPDGSKASEKPVEAKPDSAKVEPRASEAPALRPDPVPPVTPAAPAAAKPAEPAAPKPAEDAAPKPAAPAASSEPAAKPQEPAPPATAAAPPAAPAGSSGPPAPPISR